MCSIYYNYVFWGIFCIYSLHLQRGGVVRSDVFWVLFDVFCGSFHSWCHEGKHFLRLPFGICHLLSSEPLPNCCRPSPPAVSPFLLVCQRGHIHIRQGSTHLPSSYLQHTREWKSVPRCTLWFPLPWQFLNICNLAILKTILFNPRPCLCLLLRPRNKQWVVSVVSSLWELLFDNNSESSEMEISSFLDSDSL